MISTKHPLAALGLAVVLTACGSSDTTEPSVAADDSVAPTTSEVVDETTTTADSTAAPPTVEAETTTSEASTSEVEADGPAAVVVTAPGLFPEGLTYDPVGHRFIIGSFWTGQLLAVGADGSSIPFAAPPGANLTGVEADPDGGRLLVAVTGLPSGTSMLSVHDLATGEQLELIDFASVLDNPARFANGITFDDDGNVYVTDTGAGVIYKVDSSYEASVFAEHESFAPVQAGPTASGLNGVVYHDGSLIVAHAPTGQLLKVSLDDPSNPTPIPTGVDGMAIDGLHLSDDGGTLAVVSNYGSVHLFESDDWDTATAVGQFDVGETFPTSVTDRDGVFYVLQGHLDKIPDPSVDTFEIVPVVVN